MKTTFFIQNLKCGGCAQTITDTLTTVPGIENVLVSTANDSVSFGYSEKDDLNIVKETLRKLGYPIDGEKNSLTRKLTSYVSCAIGRIK